MSNTKNVSSAGNKMNEAAAATDVSIVPKVTSTDIARKLVEALRQSREQFDPHLKEMLDNPDYSRSTEVEALRRLREELYYAERISLYLLDLVEQETRAESIENGKLRCVEVTPEQIEDALRYAESLERNERRELVEADLSGRTAVEGGDDGIEEKLVSQSHRDNEIKLSNEELLRVAADLLDNAITSGNRTLSSCESTMAKMEKA